MYHLPIFYFISLGSTNQRQQLIINGQKNQSYFQNYIYSRNLYKQETKKYLKDQSNKPNPKASVLKQSSKCTYNENIYLLLAFGGYSYLH